MRQPPTKPTLKPAPGFNYPYGFPLDYVPVTPTGRIYRVKRQLRRAFNAAMIAAATIAAFMWGFS